MNLKFAAALVAGTAAVTMLAGCPVPGTTPDTGTPFTFASDSMLTGKVTYDGGAVAYQDSAYTQKVEVKEAGAASRLPAKADIEQGMYFQYKNLTEGKAYQAIIDYTGTAPTKAADINAMRLYVSAPATASAAAADPMLTFDLEWVLNPTPAYNAEVTTFPMTFKFDGIQNLDAKYQVLVNRADGTAFWSSAWGTVKEISWNGKAGTETNSPGGANITDGDYKYIVKFTKADGTYGGANVFGETQAIPFKVALPK